MDTHGRSTHISNQYSHVFLQWECNEKLHLHATEFTSSLSHRDASSRYSTAMRPRASLVTFSGYYFWKRHTQGIILGSRGCRGGSEHKFGNMFAFLQFISFIGYIAKMWCVYLSLYFDRTAKHVTNNRVQQAGGDPLIEGLRHRNSGPVG